jgi:GNAT superfamily N-acetyltransferase
MDAIHITHLSTSEQETAIDTMVQCFGEDYRDAARKDVAATFADYPYTPISLIAKIDGRAVGFTQIIISYFQFNTYSVTWLCVLPEFRRRGIAARILDFAEKFVAHERFQGKDGTFMLIARDQEYYKKLGYQTGINTHTGCPIMVKYARDLKSS